MKKRSWYLAAAVAVVLGLIGGVAFAYFAQGSTGSGTATGTLGSGAAATPITIGGSFPNGTLIPGGQVTVALTYTAPAGVTIQTVHLASVGVDATHLAAGCLASWFTMPDVAENLITDGVSSSMPNSGHLAMSNPAVDQSACKAATLTLNLTSN